MRREWGGWIKERKWREFETLAKTEPSQPLADTIAELERGFPDKADRKALRKVLFLLGQQGYHPRPIEIEPAEEALAETLPTDFAHLSAPNPVGVTSLTYGRFEGGKYRVLFVEYGDNAIGNVEESEISLDRAAIYVKEAGDVEATALNFAAVPPEYARWRLNQAILSNRHFLPPTIAYWRTFIERTTVAAHPAEALLRLPTSTDELTVFMSEPMSPPWEIEMDALRPLALELIERGLQSNWSEEELRAVVEKGIDSAQESMLSDEAIRAHTMRLLDTAYIWHLHEEPNESYAVALADDLRANGRQSVYATVLLRRACERIMSAQENIRKTREKNSAPS